MPALSVQVQPNLAPALDLNAVLGLFTSAAEVADAELEVTEGEDDGLYVNYDFRAQDLARLWEILQGQVFWNQAIGPALATASIVTCEGNRGWDDYLLLHHYDRTLALDTLRGG
jgi:hypothetical protein